MDILKERRHNGSAPYHPFLIPYTLKEVLTLGVFSFLLDLHIFVPDLLIIVYTQDSRIEHRIFARFSLIVIVLTESVCLLRQ